MLVLFNSTWFFFSPWSRQFILFSHNKNRSLFKPTLFQNFLSASITACSIFFYLQLRIFFRGHLFIKTPLSCLQMCVSISFHCTSHELSYSYSVGINTVHYSLYDFQDIIQLSSNSLKPFQNLSITTIAVCHRKNYCAMSDFFPFSDCKRFFWKKCP